MNKVVLYAHGGSMNHGCEAIVRSLIKVLNLSQKDLLLSNQPDEDSKYGLDQIISIQKSVSEVPTGLLYNLKSKLSGSPDSYYYRCKYKNLTKLVKGYDVALSIGGDNYCYRGMDHEMMVMRQLIAEAGVPQILIGCSVEVDTLSKTILDDLRQYKYIFTRETLTYEGLKKAGFTNVKLYPDSAFQLNRSDLLLPEGFKEKETVGINLSPLVLRKESFQGIVMKNYVQLIHHILDTTNLQVALIPHVIWSHNDDRQPLEKLYQEFRDTGRVILLGDHNAEEQKGFIARCRFMIAARTHASIAAYSQGVPTLVVGYSIKARGIAKDLFGTEENYVLPVQSLREISDLTKTFCWLQEHETEVRDHLATILPNYKSQLENLCL